MKVRTVLGVLAGFVVLVLVPAGAIGDSKTKTFELLMDPEHANIGVAPKGDRIEITCNATGGDCGSFAVHPKSLPSAPSGEFVHRDSAGNVVGSGTWRATELLSFQEYGCRFIPSEDLDLGDDNLCGGALKLRVVLETAGGDLDAVLTVFCIVGRKAPSSHDEPPEEGVTLNVPGGINFNHAAGGGNVYVRQ